MILVMMDNEGCYDDSDDDNDSDSMIALAIVR